MKHVRSMYLSEADMYAAMNAEIADLQQQLNEANRRGEWVAVSNALPESGKSVLATYINALGNSRVIKAMWADRFSIEASCDDDLDIDYSEESDCYYYPVGWYELIDNWDEYTAVVVHQGEVTHWMPLPASPTATSKRGGE